MKIVSLIASLGEAGGAETLVRNLSLAYRDRGHSCHVLYISDAASLRASAELEASFIAQLDAAGIGHSCLGHACRRNPLLGAWRLRRILRELRPDVFHCHLGWGLLFQALGAVRVPTVYTHHNMVFKFSPRLFRVFDRFVDRYVGICRYCAHLLERHVRRPVVLIHNGVPRSFAAVTAPRSAPARDPLILAVGNLTLQKNYPLLVAAAREIADRLDRAGRRATFLIAGEGTARAEIETAIDRHGLRDRFLLAGARRDVAALMAKADVLAMSSSWEGLPIALIEAAMSGLPSVAPDVGGCSDIVQEGINGHLFESGDTHALADAICAIIDDPDYRSLSAAALRNGERFSLDQCVFEHLQLYETLVPRSR